MNSSLLFFAFLLCLAACSVSAQRRTWCYIQVGAPPEKMQGFIDYACGKFDCREIQPGGKCYEPNTLSIHTAYALDLVYRNTNFCNQEIGQIVLTDPSSSVCIYP